MSCPWSARSLGTETTLAGFRVRYTLATELVNELVEAADERILTKTIARPGRVDLLRIDEMGYRVSKDLVLDRPLATGLALRCRALLADDGDADALRLYERPGGPYEHARTQLVYGEWLRRRRRRRRA